ncbi:ABC transporter permease [Mycolicibacterium holsaticum DSM 44478 = JCM 12374]|nr:ABC transporter permease [Mycolicibacterium holsaticum]QZA12362.1 ABC transporter permease [Mycolicibacterium holsaticum DSM 44478 = JCM 12374]UNC10153.1 ABC transporter permease [Mycolicibacterium holsaticum DSM 44478 = JCM 12374]
MSAPSRHFWPRTTRMITKFTDEWNRAGIQAAFYARSLALIPNALVRYKVETLRVIAQTSLGVGTLAAIGGTVVIVTFLLMSLGALNGLEAHRSLSHVGADAVGGFFSAYVTTRVSAPLITNIALAATIGAGATAQLGAMRINEEVDALEVMSINSMAYLVSTRVMAGVIVTVPLFCLSAEAAYLTTRVVYIHAFGQSAGVYDHYFSTYLRPLDLIWALTQAVGTALVVMLLHTYYGFTAKGGPAGVGEAVGRAVRASLIVSVATTLMIGMAVYGKTGDFNLAG